MREAKYHIECAARKLMKNYTMCKMYVALNANFKNITNEKKITLLTFYSKTKINFPNEIFSEWYDK